jgi:Na+-translocating ferredoxin:NAD+ oxidoreductase subunit B
MSILIPILTLTALGIIFGVGLAIAAKKFCVQSDPRLDQIYAHLPGANCGACGMPGCIGFAEGLIQGTCSVEKCVVSSKQNKTEIAGILGLAVQDTVRKHAVLHCHGGKIRVQDKFSYSGIQECIAANLTLGGPKACRYGCIGFGDCSRACPFGAITMCAEGLPVIHIEKCTACGKCVAACPKKLFSLMPEDKDYIVRCKSPDIGKNVLQVCSVGCIACKKCENVCPVSPVKAITVRNNLAVIDYTICTNCGECLKVCPRKTIADKKSV